MRWSQSDAGVLLTLLLAAPLPAAAMLRCDHVQAGGKKFDFSKLGGPHSVVTSQHKPPIYLNTTYTVDLCRPLKKAKDAPKRETCPNGTRVCAIQRDIDPEKEGKDAETVSGVIPIAGELADLGGKPLDYKATRLKTSDSTADAKKIGVRLLLQGGAYPLEDKPSERREQRAIIELLCSDKAGLEDEWTPEDKYEVGDSSAPWLGRREDEKEDDPETPHSGEHQLLKSKDAPLIFESYGPLSDDKNIDVLRLTWHTKYACEEQAQDDEEPNEESKHWGFFTWLVILVFLATATYLIFGSWLNYNRYGARGWDLLPHGDTIRDVPYLLKDWTRRVLNTVQGSGSRGGYSAV